jgi:predicted ATPase/DNA-binding SARP family transcriptional activator
VVTVAVSLLGPIEVDDGSGPCPVAGVKLQALLAMLALAVPNAVSKDRLIDELWGDDQPGNPVNALQAQVSELRRMLGRDAVVRAGSGYVLRVDGEAIDAVRFEAHITAGRDAASHADHAAASERFAAAVALIRGPPLAGVLDHPFARDAAPRLDELVVAAHEGYVDAELACGHHAAMTAQLARLVSSHPLWERFHAQLILALFRCGRQADALRACRRARRILADEVGLEPGPELRALEQAVLSHDPALTAPVALTSVGSQPALPLPLTSFVGRGDELDTLQGVAVGSRLVTVVGAAGVGKTRLALEYARTVAADCEVRFVDLTLVADPMRVDELMADAVGAPDRAPSGGQRVRASPAERAVERIADRAVVIVVDNCEHVLSAVVGVVERLLSACPRLRIVATSREPLGLDGEDQVALGSLIDDDAVALFTARARAVRPGFTADAAHLVELCRRLDGLPLAIELAAARTKSLPPSEIMARLVDRFGLLVSSRPAGSDRPRTLRAAIDWSYDLLVEDEQRAFRQLAVFAGGFTTGAAEAVCGADALDVVARLVDKSLLVADTSGTTARYRMLESLRDYGLERLADTGELTAARLVQLRWCTSLAEDAEAGIRTTAQLSWLARLDDEHDNLQAALAQAAADDPVAGLRLIGSLALPWWCRSRGHEARFWVETFLAAAVAPPLDALGKVLTWSGLLADFGGGPNHTGGLERELELAARRQQQALAIGLELGDDLAVAYARSQRSLTLTRQALAGVAIDWHEVATLIGKALDGFAACGDQFGAGETRTMQAVGLLVTGDVDGCMHAADAARAHAAHSGDRFVQGRVEWLEGLVADAAGDVDGAYRHIERGLVLLDELGMGQEVTAQAGLLIALAERRAMPELAAQWRTFVAGRTGGLTRHDVLLQASARNIEAHQARTAGQLDRAWDAHQAALAGYRHAEVLRAIAFTESSLGFLAAQMGNGSAAAAHHAEALRVAARADDPGSLALSFEGLAAGFGVGQAEWAATLLGAADRWWTEPGTEPSHREDIAVTTARVRLSLGNASFAAAHDRGHRLDRVAAVDFARTPRVTPAPTDPR